MSRWDHKKNLAHSRVFCFPPRQEDYPEWNFCEVGGRQGNTLKIEDPLSMQHFEL